MTFATIADIYDAIKHCNGEYCSICFCPSSERKLVTPAFIVQLRFSIKYSKIDGFQKRELKVCYICEAMAARTVRFQQVVTLAASVEAMLTWMTDDLRDVMVQLQYLPNTYVPNEMNCTIQRMKEVEATLQNTAVPQLASSHVLVVGSDIPPPPSTTDIAVTRLNSTRPFGTAPGGTRLQNEVKNPAKILTKPSPKDRTLDICNEPILVEDDPPPQRGLVHVSSVPGQLQLQVKEQATGNVALHPIIVGTNEKMYVPSLKVQIVNNEILKSVSDEELFKYANVPIPLPPVVPLEPLPSETNNTTQNKQKNSTMIDNYVDFIKKQSEHKEKYENTLKEKYEKKHKEIYENKNKEIHENKDPLELDKDDTTLNKKARLEESISIDGVINGIKDSVRDVILPVRTYAMKKPVLQMHKVLDWEDKIPMDVISFMDATDPNPNERIMQPNRPMSPPTMGVISDVRTINDNENNAFDNNEDIFVNYNDDNDVVLVENIECIDLC